MTLRGYQSAAIEQTLAALERSGSAVLQMPTGAGKTKTATEIIANHDGIVWFLCHRKEIIRQAAKAFRASGIDFGVISPAKDPETEKKYRFEPEKRVQLASVGSIGRRIADLPSPSLVIWDECQHTPADSWRALRDKTLDAKHIGLTATPERLDGAGLRDLFDDMIVGPSIDELVADGYLSKYRYFAPSEPDLTAARMRGGDYRREDLDKVMNTPILIGDAVAEYKKSVPGKRALVFAASVDASKALVERFLSEGVPAAHVDGDTPDDERDAAVAALASGEICVLSNVEVFTEGFDIPAIDAVILMRPTRSVRLLLQMIGRALRVADGKDGAMIFDHAGLYNEHGWFADDWHWSLDGGAAKERRKALERGPRKCPECKEVRAERVEVCACGFEFPMGREIGEFDGVLREIRGEVPEGCETQTEFARRIGSECKRVSYLVHSRKMPNIDGHPQIKEALLWLMANPEKSIPDGCIEVARFARMAGVSSTYVRSRIKDGDLVVVDGYPLVDSGLAWIEKNRKVVPEGCETVHAFAARSGAAHATVKASLSRGLPNLRGFPIIEDGLRWMDEKAKQPPPEGMQSINAFSKDMSVSFDTVKRWIRDGMPSQNGLVVTVAAKEWVEANVDFKRISKLQKPRPPIGFEARNTFGRRHGVSLGTIKAWIGLGLPSNDSFIDVFRGDEWVAQNAEMIDARKRLSRGVKPVGHVSIVWFASALGIARYHVRYSLVDSGLPYDHKYGIPIQAALEWVRDNRPDIVIPPEAWPAANDNTAATKAA